MEQVDTSRFDDIAELVGDTPFTVTPYFLLRRRACDVFADDRLQPRCVAVIPHTPLPDVYVLGATSLDSAALDDLAGFLGRLDPAGGLFVPADLVPMIRARRRIHLEVEGLCFTYPKIPADHSVWRPELIRQLGRAQASMTGTLPPGADFLHWNFGTYEALLTEGLAFGVVRDEQLVSLAASLALTPNYCDVGVYTRRRYRHRGYGTDCAEALCAHVLARGMRPLWRIGVRQRVAIYFAEKLQMEEIGTDGREVYLQTHAAR